MKNRVRNALFLSLPPTLGLGSGKLCVAITLVFALGMAASLAGTVTLKADDAANTTSFTGSTNWNPSGAPSHGNSYFTGTHAIRSVNNVTTHSTNIFGGDTLSIDSGGRFLGKVGNNSAGNTTLANNTANYILNGGLIDQAGANNDSAICVIGGTVSVNAASFLGAFGGTSSGSTSFETLNIVAPISGSAAVQVSGANVNSGADTGVVVLGAANPYSGTITVTNANGGVVASAVNRILQLNNVNALSNATLNLVAAVANPVSFSNAVNSAAFNVGGLTGTSSQALSDTAGSAVTLNVGGNNSSSVFGGSLMGNGNLVKAGAGTFTLSGYNTFSGVTIISNGTVAVSGSGRLASSVNIASSGATLDSSGLSGSSLTMAAGATLSGIGQINGSIAMSSTAALSPGNNAVGTLTVLANLTLNSGSSNVLELGTSAAGVNDLVLVGGALACNNSIIYVSATGGTANLDTSDYVLFYATNGIMGTCAATPIFLGTAPANASHYTVVSSGNTVVLHYNVQLPPTCATTALPTTLAPGQNIFVSVTTANGSGTVTGVTLDASSIGGGSSVTMVPDGIMVNVWTNTFTVSSGTSAGSKTLIATVTDNHGLSGSSSVSLMVTNLELIQNPILPGDHADPFIGYFAGQYWIYPTSENTRSFHAYSSSNLVDWVDQGQVFNLSQASWATNAYGWAPCVVYFNGNYYYYFAAGGAAGWQYSKIGVAVGPTPTGPFTDSGAPLVVSQTTSPHIEAIDPMVFIDTDGKAYLYYGGSGGGNLGIQQLDTNTMTALIGSLSVVTPANFTEASFMSKRNGVYYISYSNGSWENNTYNVQYAISSSPVGPWTYKGRILTSDSLHKGPGSHAFLQLPNTDTWYICYHYWDSVYSARHTALDSFTYNSDGSIKPVTMTGGGVVTRWESYSVPGYYLFHTNGVGQLTDSAWTDETSQFLMVPGLANKAPNAVSFESVDTPSEYLRLDTSSGQLVIDTWTLGGTFNADATFFVEPGLAGGTNVSFESYEYPGDYIRQNNSLVYVQSGNGSAFNSDATWKPWTASQLLNLQITSTNGNRVAVTWDATWNGVGTLLQATNLNGPWVSNSSAVSPFVVNPTNVTRFYRVAQ